MTTIVVSEYLLDFTVTAEIEQGCQTCTSLQQFTAKLRSLAKLGVSPFTLGGNEARPHLLADIITLERAGRGGASSGSDCKSAEAVGHEAFTQTQ